MNEREKAVKTLSANIRQSVKRAKQRGITGMSLANLKQVTPTKGLTCEVGMYHTIFPEVARKVAKGFLTD